MIKGLEAGFPMFMDGRGRNEYLLFARLLLKLVKRRTCISWALAHLAGVWFVWALQTTALQPGHTTSATKTPSVPLLSICTQLFNTHRSIHLRLSRSFTAGVTWSISLWHLVTASHPTSFLCQLLVGFSSNLLFSLPVVTDRLPHHSNPRLHD